MSQDKTTVRFAIDTGGTFTDIVVLDESSGEFYMDKAATTPENTIYGVLAAIDKAKVRLGDVERFFVHGSTTALNTLLERKGVPTAYVTTKGFRDVPQIMRYNRPEMYNPKYRKPPQIVPRELRFEVTERINAAGEVLTPLDEAEARSVARQIRDTEVRAVAVCLLHAYRNPRHEERLREIFTGEIPEVSTAISSAVAPEHREFERSMTTILNAYLAPVVERWVGDLERELRARGFKGQIVLTKSDGGGMTAEAAKRSPINMLLSGPAGGVIGGQYMAAVSGYRDLITMDVGGTSFDVATIRGGAAGTQQQTSVDGYPILISNLDIRTIGAGGGSLAWIDAAGALHVGPQSAAAKPGPICYRRGGTQPTVTDAFLINGYIDGGYFLGGQMSLDAQGARKGIEEQVAQPLKMTLMEASSGILRIATANMGEAVKSMASESGDDPRDHAMLCFGGGGPLFGAFLMDELALPAAIVPIVPAAFSAWGMLMVDLRHDVAKTISVKAQALTPGFLKEQFAQLAERGQRLLEEEGVPGSWRELLFSIDMRYVGQEHAVSVPFDPQAAGGDSPARLGADFEKVYETVYGYRLGLPAELVNLRVKAVGRIPRPQIRKIGSAAGSNPRPKGHRRVYDFLLGRWLECDAYERSALPAGAQIRGPVLIDEPTTTTVVRSGQSLTVDPLGNLVITRVKQ